MAWQINNTIQGIIKSFTDSLVSNNPEAYGIVYADDVSGHRTVLDLDTLKIIPTSILSKTRGVNGNKDALGQLWWVQSDNSYYMLTKWSKTQASAGAPYTATTLSDWTKIMMVKHPVELNESQKIYHYLAADGKWKNFAQFDDDAIYGKLDTPVHSTTDTKYQVQIDGHPRNIQQSYIIWDSTHLKLTLPKKIIEWWDDHYSRVEIDRKLQRLWENMVWKPTVANYAELLKKYDSSDENHTPKEGWTVAVQDTNEIYRYDVETKSWINIFKSSFDLATAVRNGIVSSHLYKALQDLFGISAESVNATYGGPGTYRGIYNDADIKWNTTIDLTNPTDNFLGWTRKRLDDKFKTLDKQDELLDQKIDNLYWKASVASQTNIATTYGDTLNKVYGNGAQLKEGWVVSVNDTNSIFRFNGNTDKWQNILTNVNDIATRNRIGLTSMYLYQALADLLGIDPSKVNPTYTTGNYTNVYTDKVKYDTVIDETVPTDDLKGWSRKRLDIKFRLLDKEDAKLWHEFEELNKANTWRNALANMATVNSTYPLTPTEGKLSPKNGWIITTNDDKRIFRFNGTAWEDIFQMTVNLSTDSRNGLISATDHLKLTNLHNEATTYLYSHQEITNNNITRPQATIGTRFDTTNGILANNHSGTFAGDGKKYRHPTYHPLSILYDLDPQWLSKLQLDPQVWNDRWPQYDEITNKFTNKLFFHKNTGSISTSANDVLLGSYDNLTKDSKNVKIVLGSSFSPTWGAEGTDNVLRIAHKNQTTAVTAVLTDNIRDVIWDGQGHITGYRNISTLRNPKYIKFRNGTTDTLTYDGYAERTFSVNNTEDLKFTTSGSNTILNHVNSVTAVTTSTYNKIKYDKFGHITGNDALTNTDVSNIIKILSKIEYVAGASGANHVLTDADYIVTNQIGEEATQPYHRRSIQYLYDYIKKKNSEVGNRRAGVATGEEDGGKAENSRTLQGLELNERADCINKDANKVMRTDANGYSLFGRMYTDIAAETFTNAKYVYVTNASDTDKYIRKVQVNTAFKTALGLTWGDIASKPNIKLTGAVTGSVQIPNTGEISIATTANHTHTLANLTDGDKFWYSTRQTNIDCEAGGDVLKNIPVKPGSYSTVHSGWSGAVHVFHAQCSNSNLGFLINGGAKNRIRVLQAVDSNAASWTESGTIAYLSDITGGTQVVKAGGTLELKSNGNYCYLSGIETPSTEAGGMLYQNGVGFQKNSDFGFVRFNSTTDNTSYLEIATGDNGNEPIYARQYLINGAVKNEITLLDASGNSIFKTIKKSGGTSTQILMADGSVNTVVNKTTAGNGQFVSTTAQNIQIPSLSFLAYWNGAHSGTSSNLAYCNRGAFGTIVTKATTDYAYNGGSGSIGGSNVACTTAQFVAKLKELGAFNYKEWKYQCSWSYAANWIITDTNCGNIQLAGCTIKVYSNSENHYHIEVITSPAISTTIAGSAVKNVVFIYRYHGDTYAPNWQRLANYADIENIKSGGADKWTTARTLTLSGAVTGSVSIDGSQNVTLNTTVNHTHNYAGSASAGGHANTLALNPSGLEAATYGSYGGIVQTSTGNAETSQWFNRLKILHNNSAGYYTELGMAFTGTSGVYFRRNSGGTVSSWRRLAFVDEVLSNTIKYALSSSVGGDASYADALDLYTSFTDFNSSALLRNGLYNYGSTSITNSYVGASAATAYGTLFQFSNVKNPTAGTNSHWVNQMAWSTADRIWVRQRINTGNWTTWKGLAYTTDNVASATSLQTARTLKIGNTGKTFNGTANVTWTLAEIGAASSTHNHATLAHKEVLGDIRAVATTPNDYNGIFKSVGMKNRTTMGAPGTATYVNGFGWRGWSDSSGGYAWEIFGDNSRLYARSGSTTTWGAWQTIAWQSDLASYATTSHNHDSVYSKLGHAHAWADITGKPSSFTPASHSHAWSEITSKPTTIAYTNVAQTWTAYQNFTAGAGNSGSDMRFKFGIKSVKNILDKLNEITLISYKWKKKGEEERDTFGVNATQLLQMGGIFAKIVHERPDEDKTKWIEYDRIGVLALKGVQELYRKQKSDTRNLRKQINKQQTEIELLQREVELMKKKLRKFNDLENKIAELSKKFGL